MNQKNIERFYDFYDQIADLLYHKYQKPYIEGMNEAFNLLLDDECSGTYEEEDLNTMRQYRDDITDVSFEKEEIRKSVQLGMLKGYKHMYESNALMTPDSIGIFIGYLVKKLYKGKIIKSIFDPFVGSGNLVYTVANQLDGKEKIYGIDNDLVKCQIARNLGDLLEYQNEMFFQDSLTFYNTGFDVIVTDLPENDGEQYMKFQYLNHHIDSIQDGGFLFALISNDFFTRQGSDIFKQEIDKKAYSFGLVKLSETLFKSNPKSILILRKKGEHIKPLTDFLLVDLPSFNDLQGMENTIKQIDLWITSREDDIL